MKKMKRILAVVLVIGIVLGFAGCGKEETVDGEIPTLTWFVPGNEQPDLDSVLAEVNKITEQEIGARIKMQFIATGSYAERMRMNMASGSDYDLCFTSNWLNNFIDNVKLGAFYDISEFEDEELQELIPEKYLKNARYEGGLYAVPNMQTMAQPLAVKARRDLLEKYNFDLDSVETIDDIEPFLEIIKQNEPDLYPYRTAWGVSPWILGEWAEMQGVKLLFDWDTHEFVPMWECDDYNHAVSQLRSWYQKGYIRSDVASMGDDTTALNQGKYAVVIDSWKPGAEAQENTKNYPYEFKIVVPARTEGTAGRNTMTAVGLNSKHPELAYKFIKLINSNVELYNLVCNGIEGKHYTKNEDGKIVNIQDGGYYPNSDWEFGNQFNAYIKEGMEDDVWEQTKKLNEEAKENPMVGFDFDKTPVEIELSNMKSVVSEYSDFITVADYDAYLEEFIQKMKVAGMDKVYTEIEKQLTEFLADN